MEELNHKGEKCLYAKILCQEGICSNCELYHIHMRLEIEHGGIKIKTKT